MNKTLKKATVLTLNQVGRLANREAAKHIKTKFNVKQRDIRINHRVFLKRADARFLSQFEFVIFVRHVPRGLEKYDPQPTTGGTLVRVEKRQSFIRDGFVSVWRKGQSGKFVFVRDPKLGTYSRKGEKNLRTKRKTLFGPSIADMYRGKKLLKVIRETVENNFERILGEQFNKRFK